MRGTSGLQAKDGMSRSAEMSRQSMRAFMAALEQGGQLISIPQPVSLDYELGACLAQADGGPAIRFAAVRGSDMPVVGNLLNSRSRIAKGLGATPQALQSSIISAIEQPAAHRIVTSAPCQESIIAGPVLTDELPIPRFFEHEGGPYITAGVIVAKDRQDGRTNLSIARLMPIGDNRAFIGIAPNHHLAVLARAAQARGETLDIAVCIGNHPAVLVAACLYLGLGDDELTVAGALLGEPLDVIRCVGIDLLVPAHCECVLEGTLDAVQIRGGGAGQRVSRHVREIWRRHARYLHASDAAVRRMLSGHSAGLPSRALSARRSVDRGGLGADGAHQRAVGAASCGRHGWRGPASRGGFARREPCGRGTKGDVRDLGGGQPDQASRCRG